MRNTFTKTLYQKRKLALWWVIGIMAMTIFTMAFFPTFRDSQIAESFSQLPAAVQKLAGDVNAYKTIGGYVSQQIFALRLPLLTIILAIALFAGLSAGEEQSGKVETQLALPISRSRLLAEKILAGTAVLAVACLALMVAVEIGALVVGESYAWGNALKWSLSCFILSLVVGLIAFAVGSSTGSKALALGVASGVAFGSYLITSLAASVSSLKAFDKVSLFHYYPTGPTLSASQLLLFGALAATCLIVSFTVFNRRDIRG